MNYLVFDTVDSEGQEYTHLVRLDKEEVKKDLLDFTEKIKVSNLDIQRVGITNKLFEVNNYEILY